MGEALAALPGQPAPPDPDAQATITDFIDYTEFFPSDLFRSTTLIGKLDESYLQHVAKVHKLTKTYSNLPNTPASHRPDPMTLRKDISIALASALNCRESAYAEASRLSTVADNLTARIATILRKLQALPKPPSRDPTPVPKPRSPVSQRGRKGTDLLKLKTESEPGDVGSRSVGRPRQFKRRLIVPGEVLPPFEPGSPGASEESESESDRPPTPILQIREKIPKVIRARMGTNIHSSVAGISVSNAMAQLEPPPPNPPLGSKHAPWLKLTEWELNKIRKRMKKNADWLPSEIMIKRELAAAGRGTANFIAAKARAAETGEEFLDEEPEDFKRPVNFRLRAIQPVIGPGGEEQLINNGMKLNEAKKLKRKLMLEEAAEREEANRRITEAGLAVNDLFAPTNGNILGATPATDPPNKSKKRKRLSSPLADSPVLDDEDSSSDVHVPNEPKKIKLGPLRSQRTDTRRSGVAGDTANDQDWHVLHPSSSNLPSRRGESSKTRSSRMQSKATTPAPEVHDRRTPQPSAGIKLKLDPAKLTAADTAVETPNVAHKSKIASGGQGVPNSIQSETAAGRRSKRTSNGRRPSESEAKPLQDLTGNHRTIKLTQGSKSGPNGSASEPEQNGSTDEVYCLCRQGGGGRMIACEDPSCKIEWFHFECVGLNPKADKRFSRLYWYCPDCRGKHGVGGDGTTTKD